jgi:hypothetical protein
LLHLKPASGGGPRPAQKQGPILKVNYLLRFHVGFLHRLEPKPPVVPPALMTVVDALEAFDVMEADLNLRVIEAQNDIPILPVVGVKP